MQYLADVHSLLRWVVLAALVGSVVLALWRRREDWGKNGHSPYALTAVLLDIQVLIGVIIWLGNRGWEFNAFVAYIHPVAMFVALGVVHVSIGRARKAARPDLTVGVGFLAVLVVLALGIPWVR